MNLNQLDTKLIKSAIECEKNNGNFFTSWLEQDTTIDNTAFDIIRGKFDSWDVEYKLGTLYLYGQTEPLSGIDRVPVINPR
jgi:hypothetical protein